MLEEHVQSYNIGKFSSRASAALGGLMLALMALVAFLPNTQAQQTADSQELELGVLIVSRAEDAAAILKQLKAGADFGVLAREKSIDTTANQGGYLGRLSLASLRPELADAVHRRRPHAPSGLRDPYHLSRPTASPRSGSSANPFTARFGSYTRRPQRFRHDQCGISLARLSQAGWLERRSAPALRSPEGVVCLGSGSPGEVPGCGRR
jgi:hypothetical protein